MADFSRPLDDQVPDGKRLEAAAVIAMTVYGISIEHTRYMATCFPSQYIAILAIASRELARLKEIDANLIADRLQGVADWLQNNNYRDKKLTILEAVASLRQLARLKESGE